jgi:thiosulfate/3-mercaptopyruvate sulfurtransferase
MKSDHPGKSFVAIALIVLAFSSLVAVWALAPHGTGSAPQTQAAERSSPTGSDLIQPAELVALSKSAKGARPLVLHVGFHILYTQAHIPGSEYIGPASESEGIQRLRQRVQALPRTQYIVLYCGCCPWNKCPNVEPAYKELRALGFRNVKLLYIADNFGKDWVDKGYPVAKGE